MWNQQIQLVTFTPLDPLGLHVKPFTVMTPRGLQHAASVGPSWSQAASSKAEAPHVESRHSPGFEHWT